MDCAEVLRVQAYFDGELDPVAAAGIERHVAGCTACQALLEELGAVRSVMRRAETCAVPAQLRRQISSALEQESSESPGSWRRRHARAGQFWMGVLSGIGGSAVAAALGWALLVPLLANPLPGELVDDHTRSLLSSHLIDVVSTDQHTVKPWFAGRVAVSPVVADFAQQGYRLLGGRVDDLGSRKAAVVVYQHGRHYINVFSWVAGSGPTPADATRHGYHLAFWKIADLDYCAVSDAGWSELQDLVGLLQRQAEREAIRRPSPILE